MDDLYKEQTEKALQGWAFFTHMTKIAVIVAAAILGLMALFLV